jgi:hypothetical protein
MKTINLEYVDSKWLSVSEALNLEHGGFQCKLIVNGIEKDLYEIYVIKGA